MYKNLFVSSIKIKNTKLLYNIYLLVCLTIIFVLALLSRFVIHLLNNNQLTTKSKISLGRFAVTFKNEYKSDNNKYLSIPSNNILKFIYKKKLNILFNTLELLSYTLLLIILLLL